MDRLRKSRWERTPRVDEEIKRTTEAFQAGRIRVKSKEEAGGLFTETQQAQNESIGEQAGRDEIERLFTQLTKNEALVMRLRFGLLGHPSVAALGIQPDSKESFTQERVARFMHVTREMVKLHEFKALRKLLRNFNRRALSKLFERNMPDSPDWKELNRLRYKYVKKER